MSFIGNLDDENWTSLERTRTNRSSMGMNPLLYYVRGGTWGAGWGNAGLFPSANNESELVDVQGTNRVDRSGIESNGSAWQFWKDKAFFFHIETSSSTLRVDKYTLPGLALSADVYTDNMSVTGALFATVNAVLAPWSDKIHVIAGAWDNSPRLSRYRIYEFDPDAETAIIMYDNGSNATVLNIYGLGADSTNVFFITDETSAVNQTFRRSTILEAGGASQSRTNVYSNVGFVAGETPPGTFKNYVGQYGLYFSNMDGPMELRDFANTTLWDLDLESGSDLDLLTMLTTEEKVGPPYDVLCTYVNGSIRYVTLEVGGTLGSNTQIATVSGLTDFSRGMGIQMANTVGLDRELEFIVAGGVSNHSYTNLRQVQVE